MDLSKTQPTVEALQAGVWVDYHDAKLQIGSASNPNYRNAQSQKMRDVMIEKKGKVQKLTAEEGAAIDLELMAEFILIGWSNISDDGVQIPYSKSAAAVLLKKYPIFAQDVQAFAVDLSLFDVKQKAAEVAVLGEASPGQ